MNKLIITLMMAFYFANCGPPPFKIASGKKYIITNYNITFAPDLSNRVNKTLYPRPLTDIDLLNVLSEDLYPSVLRCKRSQNQQDRLQVDFINKGLISRFGAQTDKLSIDFSRFPNQLARIKYIMNSPDAKPTYQQDLYSLSAEFNRVYKLAVKSNSGADIWTYLDQGIDERTVLEDEKPVSEDDITVVNHYRNVLVLSTDGYIEAGIFGKGFDLSQQTINKFRKAFLASGETDLARFFKKSKDFHIKPVHNQHLKNLEVLVLELFDRSLTSSGSATIHPTDMEIIKLFWTDWLQASGVRRFELHPFSNSKNDTDKIILDFLGVPKVHQ